MKVIEISQGSLEFMLTKGTSVSPRGKSWFQGWPVLVGKIGVAGKSGHKGHAGRPGQRGGSAPSTAFVKDPNVVVDDFFDAAEEKAEYGFDGELAERLAGNPSKFGLEGGDVVVGMGEEGGAHMLLQWVDADYNPVLEGTYDFFSKDGKPDYVEITEVGVVEEWQGQGATQSLFAQQERALKEAGYKEVHLLASRTIGKYAWAKMGFDFQEPSLGEARAAFSKWAEHKNIPSPEKGWPKFGSAQELAGYKGGELRGSDIENRDVPADLRMGLGKAFMLDKYGMGPWRGVKKL